MKPRFSAALVGLVLCAGLVACGATPRLGEIRRTRLPGGQAVSYGLAGVGEPQGGTIQGVIVALPTGAQRRRDMALDIDELWAQEARSRAWLVVCPVPPREGLFPWAPRHLFGNGPEVLIPPFATAVRQDLGVPKQGLHLVEMGGDGLAAFAAAQLAPDLFSTVLLVPFGLNQSALRSLTSVPGPPVRILVSEDRVPWYQSRIESLALPPGRLQLRAVKLPPARSASDLRAYVPLLFDSLPDGTAQSPDQLSRE